MKRLSRFWPYILIGVIVLIFFFPVLKGNIPFPGDLLVNSNPYSSQGFLGYQPGGYPNKAQGQDVITEIYPWRYFSISEIKQGSIPFWNPHNFSGNPQMANFQTALFYPFNLLYLILPFNLSWTLIIMFQPILAGFFMYFFLKKGIGLKDFSSFIGAVSFAFSSYMVVWIEYGNIGSTMLWLPLALLLTKNYFNKQNARNLLSLSAVLSLAILAGYIQGVFYIYILCFFYYIYLISTKKESFKLYKKHFLFLISFFIPFLITFFQILPTLQLFSDSTRGAYTIAQIEKNLSPLFYWITIFFPDFFGNPATRNYWVEGTYIERVMYPGSVMLFFAFFSIFNKIKFLEKKFFSIVSIISLIIATNLPFVKYFYLIPIPVISTTVATREFSIFIFSVIVLGAIGIDHFLKEKKFKNSFYLYFLIYILFGVLVLIIFKTLPGLEVNLKISLRNMVIPTGIILLTLISVFLRNKLNRKIFYVAITILVSAELFLFFHKITPFAPSGFTYPSDPVTSYLKNNAGIYRFWGYGSAYIMPNFQSVDGTYSPEGNDPLHILRYTELLSSSSNGKLPETLPRPDANISPGYGENDLKNNFYRKRIIDLLGVKYIVHKLDIESAWENPDLSTFPKEEYTLIKKTFPWQIYENKNVLPRFFLTSEYVIAKNKSQALSFIYNSSINLKNTLILEKAPDFAIDSFSTGSAKLILYKPNKVVFTTKTTGNMLLFLSDNYYLQWRVSIDGKPGEILIADYTFRAVAVPKGEHRVEFFYNPKSFFFGIGVSVLGLVILFLTAFYVKNNKEKI